MCKIRKCNRPFITLLNFKYIIYFNFQQLLLSLIVILNGSSRGFTKPLTQKLSSSRNLIFHHRLREQDSQSQVDVFQHEAKESIDEKDKVAKTEEEVAYNRTARDDDFKPCLKNSKIKWDSCRQKFVEEVYCFSTHPACYRALTQGYSYTTCKVVIGYRQVKYHSKCPALQIDCQCAAWKLYLWCLPTW